SSRSSRARSPPDSICRARSRCSSTRSASWCGPRAWRCSCPTPTRRNTASRPIAGWRARSSSRCGSTPARAWSAGSRHRAGRPGCTTSPTPRSSPSSSCRRTGRPGHGGLVAIPPVGQPVVGSMYRRGETETLFDLGSHLATAIRDIAVHNQLEREQQFSERILAHMSSGVITIGRDQRIGTINRRAEEILQLSSSEVLKQDLRALPSPLGDMLFDTLRTGRAAGRHEIQLALRGLWLEVSTYPVRGEDGAPLGAVLVFEDLTAQKELLTQKRQVEQTQLLTRVVARIADEIKNPLVSINTFIELIGERY